MSEPLSAILRRKRQFEAVGGKLSQRETAVLAQGALRSKLQQNIAFENIASQARFGIKDHILNAGEMSDGSAEQYAAKELALHYWPYLTNFGWGSGKGAFLKFSAMGWFDTLGWIVYIQDVAGGEDDADVIAAFRLNKDMV